MPNFRPLRRYVFSVVDRWIATRKLEPPFLEVGCGTGQLARHLAERGWEGVALDSSAAAAERAAQALSGFPRVRVVTGALPAAGPGPFRTLLLMDVLEHVQDDRALLRDLATRAAPGGWLVLLTPVNPSEWRHDDVVYGHYRRYGWEELEEKLSTAGFEVVERWNVTVPFMWALRRVYLALMARRPVSAGQDTLTAASSMYNPWDERPLLRIVGAALSWPIWWAPFFSVQNRFSASRRGHAAMFLARRR